MPQPLITHIQKYAIHDGQGIRVSVFFKGCPLRCAWCHNPETQTFEAEWMRYPDRCIGCGQCDRGCPTGARTLVGTAYEIPDLLAILLRDRIFFDVSGGGVTLSGGEVMAQDPAYLQDLCEGLAARGVRVAIDTCGHAPYAHFQAVLPFVDAFLYDLKGIDPEPHKRHTGVYNGLILENLRKLRRDGARINLRVAVIPGVNAEAEEMDRIIAFAREHAGACPVNLLPYHQMGREKAERMERPGTPVQSFQEPTAADLAVLREKWLAAGFDTVTIGG